MPTLSARLNLPVNDHQGAQSGSGTITTIQAGTFQAVDDRFPVATQEMMVSVDNSILFVNNEFVYI